MARRPRSKDEVKLVHMSTYMPQAMLDELDKITLSHKVWMSRNDHVRMALARYLFQMGSSDVRVIESECNLDHSVVARLLLAISELRIPPDENTIRQLIIKLSFLSGLGVELSLTTMKSFLKDTVG